MTGPSKLKGSSGGGGVIYDFFGVERVTVLTCSPLPISDQVCLQFCYSIISRLYTKTPRLSENQELFYTSGQYIYNLS